MYEYSWRLSNTDGGFSDNQGILLVSRSDSDSWGTVCDDSFDNSTAEVICGWLGFDNMVSWYNTGRGYYRYTIA